MDFGTELKGCVCRINNCAIELFSMEEDLEIEDEDSWDLVGKDLRLKATFLYIDLSRVISSCESDERKKTLTGLANKFFYFMDEKNIILEGTESRSYQFEPKEATLILGKFSPGLPELKTTSGMSATTCTSGCTMCLWPPLIYNSNFHEGARRIRETHPLPRHPEQREMRSGEEEDT